MSPYFYYTILVFTEVMLIGGGVPEPGAELGGGGGGGAGGGPALYPGVGGRPSATGLSSQAGKYNPRLVPLITVLFRRPGLRAPPPPNPFNFVCGTCVADPFCLRSAPVRYLIQV